MTTDDAAMWRVRAPREDDFDRWRELYHAYAGFYEVDQPDSSAALVWSWIGDPRHAVGCLLVEDEHGEVAGLAHYRPFPRPLAGATGCFLDDLFVDPARRGSGAVDALLSELRRIATDNGWDVVRWITAEDNHRARAKYAQYAAVTTWVTYDMPTD